MLKYPKELIYLSLCPESTNLFDPEAIKVIATVKGKGSAAIGYVSKDLNYIFNKKIKDGNRILLEIENITGTAQTILGINYSYLII